MRPIFHRSIHFVTTLAALALFAAATLVPAAAPAQCAV